MWAPRGCRPRCGGRTRFDWLYGYGFARPATGDTFARLVRRVNADRMAEVLAAFAGHADPHGRKVLLVLVDNAGWHVAKRLAVPANVRLYEGSWKGYVHLKKLPTEKCEPKGK